MTPHSRTYHLNHQVLIRLTPAGVRALAQSVNPLLPASMRRGPDDLPGTHAAHVDADGELEIQLHDLLSSFAGRWDQPGPLWHRSTFPERPTLEADTPITVTFTPLGRRVLADQGRRPAHGPVPFTVRTLSRLVGPHLGTGAPNVIEMIVGLDVGGATFTPGETLQVPLVDEDARPDAQARYVSLAGQPAWTLIPRTLTPDPTAKRFTLPMTVRAQAFDVAHLTAADGSEHHFRAHRLRRALEGRHEHL